MNNSHQYRTIIKIVGAALCGTGLLIASLSGAQEPLVKPGIMIEEAIVSADEGTGKLFASIKAKLTNCAEQKACTVSGEAVYVLKPSCSGTMLKEYTTAKKMTNLSKRVVSDTLETEVNWPEPNDECPPGEEGEIRAELDKLEFQAKVGNQVTKVSCTYDGSNGVPLECAEEGGS